MMEVIITECKNPYGKYWEFKDKASGQLLAEVDRKDGKYVVFGGKGVFTEVACHSKKDMALELAKEHIRIFIGDAVFKWNVMRKIIKYV